MEIIVGLLILLGIGKVLGKVFGFTKHSDDEQRRKSARAMYYTQQQRRR